MAFRFELQRTTEVGWPKINLYCLRLYPCRKRHFDVQDTPHMLANLLNDCKELREHFKEFQIQIEGRRGNKATDVLAKHTRRWDFVSREGSLLQHPVWLITTLLCDIVKLS
ncbi:hypothetical protein RND81_06G097000 [Saponaria officinalis]|uniref:RNase H type-1 domain-containing protein n=1 Tax=Saponaria officinalis TaxID=3572 RepID=A0AAW1K500_SAPOF